uniref:Uncharacterized protein n=1 Tax=Anopheles farauti TaxID=69004 RepID=A0A182QHL9_9DIPT
MKTETKHIALLLQGTTQIERISLGQRADFLGPSFTAPSPAPHLDDDTSEHKKQQSHYVQRELESNETPSPFGHSSSLSFPGHVRPESANKTRPLEKLTIRPKHDVEGFLSDPDLGSGSLARDIRISETVARMASGHFFWAIFYFACLCSASLANNAKVNFREKEKKILDQILGAGKYDARIRPSGINGTAGVLKQKTGPNAEPEWEQVKQTENTKTLTRVPNEFRAILDAGKRAKSLPDLLGELGKLAARCPLFGPLAIFMPPVVALAKQKKSKTGVYFYTTRRPDIDGGSSKCWDEFANQFFSHQTTHGVELTGFEFEKKLATIWRNNPAKFRPKEHQSLRAPGCSDTANRTDKNNTIIDSNRLRPEHECARAVTRSNYLLLVKSA